jgi:N-acetylmuramoyl-L-alanine amidase
MRWSRRGWRGRHFVSSLFVFALLSVVLSAAPAADEKHLSVYASVATYTLPVVDRGGREYIGLLELLEPLGRVSAMRDGSRWKLRFNAIDSEFTAGKTRAKMRGREFDLSTPFLMENSRGLVAVGSVSDVLARFLNTQITLRESARRLFIGNVAIQPSVQLDAADPGRMVLNFSAPVSPAISTEPGKLHMLFKRDPVVPAAQPAALDKVITQVNYLENNGSLEVDIAANAPLMASFSNGARTITVTATPQAAASSGGARAQPAPGQQNAAPAAAQQPGPAAGTTAEPSGAGQNVATASQGAVAHRALAVVDPAHGGDERGAALTDTLAEKTVTLGFARLLRHELEQRGFAVILLREGDASVSLDQRAGAANTARAGIFISLHATSEGTGARVYTALLPAEGTSKGAFHAWNAAQAPALSLSRAYARAIVNEMQNRQIPARGASASLRPLNNVVMPAVAVELAPGPNGIADLPSANYQEHVALAIADALVPFRDRLGVQP